MSSERRILLPVDDSEVWPNGICIPSSDLQSKTCSYRPLLCRHVNKLWHGHRRTFGAKVWVLPLDADGTADAPGQCMPGHAAGDVVHIFHVVPSPEVRDACL